MSRYEQWYHLDNMAHESEELCYLWGQDPEGMETGTWKLSKGVLVGDEYPKDARLYMPDRTPGMELCSLIGNTGGNLVVDKVLKESIERFKPEPIQYLPVAIYNHKKRLASADYFFINPIGTFDCLDWERSKIDWFEGQVGGKVVGVDEMVFNAKKVENAPAIFRVPENPRAYICREDLVQHWIAMERTPTNVNFKALIKVAG